MKLKSKIYDKFLKPSPSNNLTNVCSMAKFVLSSLRWNHNYLLAFVDNHLIHYPTPINITYAWSFGSSAGICLVVQILSGIFLAMVRLEKSQ